MLDTGPGMWREVGRTDTHVLGMHETTGHGYYISVSAWEGARRGSGWAARVIREAVVTGRVSGAPRWTLPGLREDRARAPETVERRGRVRGAERWRRPRPGRPNRAEVWFADRRAPQRTP